MNEHISHPENPTLRERLRREAMESRPAFSEPLHRQILSAVNREEPDCTHASSVSSRIMRRRFVVAAALATACTLAVVLLDGRVAEHGLQHDITKENVVVASSDAVAPSSPNASLTNLLVFDDLSDDTTKGLHGLLASTTITSQSAALKHDIRLATEVLIERLPVDMDLLAGP